MRMIALPVLLLLYGNSVFGQSSDVLQPIRNHWSDEVLLPACTGKELARLRGESDRLSADRNPKGAWLVAKAMLCGNKAPRDHMPELVSQELYGVNEDPGPTYSLAPRDRIEPLRGHVYAARVEASGNDIFYQYNTAGICVGGLKLRYRAPDWLIVRVAEACD